MADRSALGMIGIMFGAATAIVMMIGGVVVRDHLTGRLHIEDSAPMQLVSTLPVTR